MSRVLKSIPSNNLEIYHKKTGLFDDNGYENLLRYCIENNAQKIWGQSWHQNNTHQELYLEVDLFLEKLKSINYQDLQNLSNIYK